MNIKEIPSNNEAEQSVIGSMFLSTFALQKACDILTPESFYYENNRILFTVIQELYEAKTPIDSMTVTTELKNRKLLKQIGGIEFLSLVFNIVPTAGNVDQYIKIVNANAIQRRLIEVSTEITANAYDSSVDINVILDEAERKILSIVNNRRSGEIRTIKEVVQSTKVVLEKLSTSKGIVTGVPTGWTLLDKVTAGFQQGQLIIVAARPSVGKSAWALNLATNAAINANKTVAIFSLEMPAESLVTRMIAALGHIDGHKLATGNLKDDWDKVNEAGSKLENSKIFIDDSTGATIGDIRSKCRRLANSETGLDLVIVDYLQLISSNTNYGANRQQEIADISRALKLMSLELKVPVVALSQLSRSIEQRKGRPMLSDLRESGAIEQDADIVAFLHREGTTTPESEKEEVDENIQDLLFIIAKHRNGATTDIKLRFKKNISKFFNVIDTQKGE